MILKGNQRSGGIDLAIHLMNSFDNDSVEIGEIRGSVARDLLGAFSEFEAVASGTRCRQPFYSLSINPPSPLTRHQYAAALARIEQELGLCGQPRAVVFHRKHGREHCHVVWSRIDFRTMKAVHLSHDRLKLKAVARLLAAQFGLALPHGMRVRQDQSLAERAQAAASGVSPEERSHDITEAYIASDSGPAFRAALFELGYRLARGEKRGFVVVDAYGRIHSLSRQIKGVRTKQLEQKLAPLSAEDLPLASELEALPETHDKAGEAAIREELSRTIRQSYAKRRALLYADIRLLEKRQAEEMRAVQQAQGEELARTVPRLVSAVFRLLSRYPALRSVLGPIHCHTQRAMAERHTLELAALRRRHNREWREIERRERLIRLLRKREQQSLENAVLRTQRLLKRKTDMVRINAADMTARSLLTSLSGENPEEPFDAELAALEREYMGNAIAVPALAATFNEAAGLAAGDPPDGGDDGSGPLYSTAFNRTAR